jgi:serine phosphatase RsbU (regulator of sigma subunit)
MKAKTIGLLILILIVLISTPTAIAQKGVPFITSYELPDNMSNQNWAMTQSDNHLMYILNRKGVYHFDGFEWEKLNIKGKPLAIYFHNDLFISTDEGLGFVRRDARGDYNYFAIQDTSSNVYFKFFTMDNSLYMAGVQGVSRVNFSDVVVLEPIYVDRDTMQYINDCFQHNDLVYVIKSKTNILRIDGQKLIPIRFDLQKNETISFTFNHGKQVFVGTSANRLYCFNGFDFRQVTLKDQKYIEASYLNGGISIDSNRFALSTLIGGCVIVNAKTYETETTLNFANGLPDDEILSMGKDKNGGLWLAHGMGISRIDLRIPVKSYEYFQGLRGNILSVAEHNKTIYAGSSEGLFYLTEIKDYKEIEVPIKKVEPIKAAEVVKEPEPQPVQEQTPTQTEQEETKKKKKGFFARLFDKTAREEHRQAKAEEEALAKKKEELAAAMPKTPEPKKEISAEKKKIYALQSVSHAYQKVSGIDGKCKQLLIFNGKLLAVSSTGIYLVEGGQGRAILAGTYILFAKPSEYNKNSMYLCTNQGVIKLTAIADKWQANAVLSLENELPVSLVEIAEDKLMITTEFNVYKVSIVQGGQAETANLSPSGYSIDSPVARKISGTTTIFTSEYVFKYLPDRDSLVIDNTIKTKNFIKTIYSQPQYTWVSINKRWAVEGADSVPNLPAARFLNLFDRINDIFVNDRHEIFIVNNYTKIVKISAKEKDLALAEFDLFLKQVTDNEGTKLNPEDVTLSYANNALNVKISAPFFVKQKAVEFQYMVEGMMTEWTDWKTDPVQNFPYFPNGKYKLRIRARDIFGNQSPVYTLAFEIKPPFWKRLWFILLATVVVLALFVMLVKYRERQLQREKQILEEKVRERTRTIEEQKEVLAAQRDELAKTNQEILQQKEEIEAQRDEIETQRDHIAKQNDEITKSIEYAYRIQTAVMPTKEEIDTLLPDYFILFKPRDIVSGDFYWVAEKNGKIVVVAADCTGHGVPGAFMSMLGVSFLNEIVKGNSITQPNMIINHLRDMVKTTLSQTGKEGESKDGMDIAICSIDLKSNRLEYAGAYNPLYLIHNGELIEYKADKMPVGIHLNERDTFTNNEIEFLPGDMIYIFSDGYVSQFGGDDGRKFMAKPFKKLLTDISMKPMSDQRERLNARLEEWQGYHPQVDDILVIGVKF